MKIKVVYTSVWDEGSVVTSALLNIENGLVSDIEVSDEGADCNNLNYEMISYNGVIAYVDNNNDDNEYIVTEPAELKNIVDELKKTINF